MALQGGLLERVVPPLFNDAYANLEPYLPAKPLSEIERELGIAGCVNLASNENHMGMSPLAREAIQKGLNSLNEYPDAGAHHLKQRLARHLDVTPQSLITGNGSNEIIEMLVRACLRPGENVVYAWPSFIAYRLCSQAASAEVREVPLRGMRCDLAAMRGAVDRRTKLIFIANPDNPTGSYLAKPELDAFLDAVPEHVLVVLDEAYFEYVEAEDYSGGLDALNKRERFMVLRTFSKCYGLAGLRVGYGVGRPQLVDCLNRGRQPFNVNAAGQMAARAALDDTAFVKASRDMNRREKLRVAPILRELGLEVTDSQTNFLLVDFKRDIQDVFQGLLRLGVLVCPLANYDLPTCARVTLGLPEHNDRFLDAARKVAR